MSFNYRQHIHLTLFTILIKIAASAGVRCRAISDTTASSLAIIFCPPHPGASCPVGHLWHGMRKVRAVSIGRAAIPLKIKMVIDGRTDVYLPSRMYPPENQLSRQMGVIMMIEHVKTADPIRKSVTRCATR